MLDTSYHKRRTNQRLEMPEFQAEYERTRQELAQVNAVMQRLDDLRVRAGLSKAELAREIGRNDAVELGAVDAMNCRTRQHGVGARGVDLGGAVLHELLGYPNVRNYDGSWTEWGSLIDVTIEKGAPA